MNHDRLKVLIEKRLPHIPARDCKRNTSKSKRILDPQKVSGSNVDLLRKDAKWASYNSN